MEYVPLLVGAGVGLLDGVIGGFGPNQQPGTLAAGHTYAHTIYRAGVFALGAYGDLFGKFNPDVSYGLMCSSAALLGSRLPSVVHSGPSAFGYSAPAELAAPDEVVAAPVAVPATAAPSTGPLAPDAIFRRSGGVGSGAGCAPCGAGRAAAPPRGVTFQAAGSVA